MALYQAVSFLKKNYNLTRPIIKDFIGAVSAGIIKNQANLDLDYFEDSNADVDANFVICERGKIAEIQVTGEVYFVSTELCEELFNLAKYGVSTIIKKQKEILSL